MVRSRCEYFVGHVVLGDRITCRDSLVLTVAVLTDASASFGRAAILAASALTPHTSDHRSRDRQRGRMAKHGYPGTRHAHNDVPALAPRSERARSAPCLGAPLCSPRSARRSDASNAAGPAVAAYGSSAGSLRRTRSQGRHRSARKPSPRSALRASLGRFKRARGAVRGALALARQGRGLEGQLDGARAIGSRRSRAKRPASIHKAQLVRARTAAMANPCLAGGKGAKVPRRRICSLSLPTSSFQRLPSELRPLTRRSARFARFCVASALVTSAFISPSVVSRVSKSRCEHLP